MRVKTVVASSVHLPRFCFGLSLVACPQLFLARLPKISKNRLIGEKAFKKCQTSTFRFGISMMG